MKYIFTIVIVLVVILFLISSNEEKATKTENSTTPVSLSPNSNSDTSNRPYDLGLGYVTANRSLGTEAGWEKVAEAAHVAYIQRSWKEWHNGDADDDIRAALQSGLKLYLALEPLENDRTKIGLPDGIKGDFGDIQVQNAYLEQVKKIAQTYQPAYFVTNVEVDLYKPHNEVDYQNFVNFYPKIYKVVKEVSPNTLTSVSITYSDYDGQNGIDDKDKNTFRNLVADFEQNSDMLAVSTYPFSYLKPNSIPDSFLVEIANASSKPLFIAETSWVSHGFTIPIPGNAFNFEGNQDLQVQFVEKLKRAAIHADSQGKKILAINFVSLIDISSTGCNIIKFTTPHFEWFCYLGLIEENGKEKKSFQTLKMWKQELN